MGFNSAFEGLKTSVFIKLKKKLQNKVQNRKQSITYVDKSIPSLIFSARKVRNWDECLHKDIN